MASNVPSAKVKRRKVPSRGDRSIRAFLTDGKVRDADDDDRRRTRRRKPKEKSEDDSDD